MIVSKAHLAQTFALCAKGSESVAVLGVICDCICVNSATQKAHSPNKYVGYTVTVEVNVLINGETIILTLNNFQTSQSKIFHTELLVYLFKSTRDLDQVSICKSYTTFGWTTAT
jgi:hypothetical protein